MSLPRLTPVQVDGWLYVGMAVFGAAIAIMSSDESYKYVNPYILFWGKFCGSLGLAACTALKTFRYTTYADHSRVTGISDTVVKPDAKNALAKVENGATTVP